MMECVRNAMQMVNDLVSFVFSCEEEVTVKRDARGLESGGDERLEVW